MSADLMREPLVESDPRFPSGPWTGYWAQPPVRQRGIMEMLLTFNGGALTGCGRDPIGNFLFRGRYDVLSGECQWIKCYLGKHDVQYTGKTQGKGIVGHWEIRESYGVLAGRFAIWPEGEEDPTLERLAEEAEPPLVNTLEIEALPMPSLVPEEVPVGADDHS